MQSWYYSCPMSSNISKAGLDCLCFYNFEYMYGYSFHKAIMRCNAVMQIYLLFQMKHFQWPIMYRIDMNFIDKCCQYVFHKILSKYLVLHGWTIIYTTVQMKSNIFQYYWVNNLFNILACLLMHNQLKTLD